MSAPQLMVNDITVNLNKLKIDLALVYKNTGIAPKARVIFRKGDKIRRLPILLRGSFERKKSEDNIAIFSYTYLIDLLFFKDIAIEDINISFDISIGNDNYEEIPFVISEGIAAGCKDKDIDNKYIADCTFEGASIFAQTTDDIDEEDENDNNVYSFIPCPESDLIILKSVRTDLSDDKTGIFRRIISGITYIFGLLFTLILSPFLIIEGIFAGLNITKRRKCKDNLGFIGMIDAQIKANIAVVLKALIKDKNINDKLISFKTKKQINYYNKMCRKPVIRNRISFISGRRDELGGNEMYVYNLLKDNKDIDFQFLLCSDPTQFAKWKMKKQFYKLYATSKVVIVDDYYNLLNSVDKREEVTLFQLWHACGAFKTFGFSRLGKPGSPKQKSPNHRMYDCAIVSSKEIVKYYAEGFGISDSKVYPTGIPRTDIFFDNEYAENVKNGFYERYPKLKDKKIIMFAPTFRGAGQNSAYYPVSVLNPNTLYEKLNNDYAIIIKLHPFCKDKFIINEKYKDYIIDLSEEDEINDLLFVSDILITDYSSTIFEASLLNIPMIFYAYDLYQYISERDFYCDFETFVPGKIVFHQEQLSSTILAEDFESEKIEPFKNIFFSDTDGKSSQRVADLIIKKLDL